MRWMKEDGIRDRNVTGVQTCALPIFILGSYFGSKFPVETFKQIDKWIKINDEHVLWNIAMAFNCSFGNKYPGKALKYLEILSKNKSKVRSEERRVGKECR